MQNKLDQLLGNTPFLSNEKQIIHLQNSDEYNPNLIIALCQANVNYINALKDKEFYEVLHDEALQLELINKLGGYYLTLYKAFSAIKNPTEMDELKRLEYKKLAKEYHVQEVEQFDLALERNRFDEDYSFAVFLNDLEEDNVLKERGYLRQRFFKLESQDESYQFG